MYRLVEGFKVTASEASAHTLCWGKRNIIQDLIWEECGSEGDRICQSRIHLMNIIISAVSISREQVMTHILSALSVGSLPYWPCPVSLLLMFQQLSKLPLPLHRPLTIISVSTLGQKSRIKEMHSAIFLWWRTGREGKVNFQKQIRIILSTVHDVSKAHF